ncbi:MAG TPA: Maf family nucleotide pyrophosphatase [Salinivirgaceae bacterium]|nr:Maf family nucleotide pyrophosphatase [Salinivirgaceae bacterium]HQA75865.1 Maf family nucleotide pyrophosphatase [Salinivirgaceae bacterium]
MVKHTGLIEKIEKKYQIILASQSKRRQQLLSDLGFTFTIVDTLDIDESAPINLNYIETAEYIAYKKASTIKDTIGKNQLVITCDTIVVHDNQIIGKPKNRDEAVIFLKALSDSKHEVVSGVCILGYDNYKLFHDITTVWFDILTDSDINYYVDKYKPYDKAGAYGIQEWIGMIGILRIEGSYFNVMGLPTQKIYKELAEFL